jgi:hypothetical protein
MDQPGGRLSMGEYEFDAQPEIGIVEAHLAAEGIPLLEEGGQRGPHRAFTEFSGHQEEMTEARVHAQGGKLATMRSDPALAIECAKFREQEPSLGEGRGRRRIDPTQLVRLGNARRREFQGERRQIGLEYFRPRGRSPASSAADQRR